MLKTLQLFLNLKSIVTLGLNFFFFFTKEDFVRVPLLLVRNELAVYIIVFSNSRVWVFYHFVVLPFLNKKNSLLL